MDPIGFALENFDPAGLWRKNYLVIDGKGKRHSPPIDVADVLADGTRFSSFDEFRTALASRPEQLARNLAGHMVVYGTGARLSFADRDAIADIARAAASREYGVRSLLHAVVTHPIFLSK